MRAHRIAFVAALFAAAFAACDLNPQPLPPGTEGDNSASPGGRGLADASADAGAISAEVPAEDAGSPPPNPNDAEAGTDAATDAGDAGADADADAS